MRPSLRESDIEAQSAMPVPKEVNVGELVAVVIAIAVVAILIWSIGG